METLLDTLLEKAMAAHYHWIRSTSEQDKTMAELGDAIQEVKALKTTYLTCKPKMAYFDKILTHIGDKCLMTVWFFLDKKGEPYLSIERRILTKTPSLYGYEGILRRINNYYYIRSSFTLPVTAWSIFIEGCEEMKEVINAALSEFLKKKEDERLQNK